MRLVKLDCSGDAALTEDLPDDNIPPYGILSHTWDQAGGEVTFSDLNHGGGKTKVGYEKLRFCIERARESSLQYFWMDSCCIDRANLTELGESINSMFRWYRAAEVCWVYLTDVSSTKRDHSGSDVRTWEASFRSCKWLTRGWTLQELLAPASVEFYSREGRLLGTKETLSPLIADATTIPESALQGADLADFTIKERWRWATPRITTKEEDRAYCLLGIFGVFVGPIYGEKENALSRLKDEICKSYRTQLDAVDTSFSRANTLDSHIVASGARSPTPTELMPNARRRKLLESLVFEQMDSRRTNIKTAYSTTCTWLLRTKEYMDWIDLDKFEEHFGLLWVMGKPGAGKSTLIKFAHEQASKSPKNGEILLFYFFNARGENLEKSTSGMYRSLLFQLLNQAEDLLPIFDDVRGSASSSNDITWTLELLRELLTKTVRRLGQRRIKCFIDALDECDEQEIRDMIAHFEGLGEVSERRFQVCFASRHYPTIDIRFGLQLDLADQTGHDADLENYVHSHLRIGRGRRFEGVKTKILSKANGVFMWAVLVIPILNDEFRRGRVFAVQKRLDEIPEQLSDLFKHTVRRDSTNMDALLLCFQWILFSRRPLKREEFYFAMATGLTPSTDTVPGWDPDMVTEEDMKHFVHDCSKGLAELTRPRRPRKGIAQSFVQFIHESVRDFLIKDGGLRELWPDLQSDPEPRGHFKLSQCCERYMRADVSTWVPASGSLPKANSDDAASIRQAVTEKYPFLQYAVREVFHHADKAAKERAGEDFAATFDLKRWILASNIIQPHEVRRHSEHVSLLYLFAEYNCGQLIRSIYDCSAGHRTKSTERYPDPLQVAFSTNQWDAVGAILVQSGHARLDECLEILRRYVRTSNVGTDEMTVWAIQNNHEHLAEVLATISWTFAAPKSDSAAAKVRLAAERNCMGVVRTLLDQGAGEQFHHEFGFSILHFASKMGHLDLVKLLVDRGVDMQDLEKSSMAASIRNHSKVLELLLERGIDMEKQGGKLLLCASSADGLETVQCLLRQGVDPNQTMLDTYRPGLHTNPLRCALEESRWRMAGLLLDYGATADDNGQYMFCSTFFNGQWDLIKLLAERNVEPKSAFFDQMVIQLEQDHCVRLWPKNGRPLELLLDIGLDVDSFEHHLMLYAAAIHENLEVVDAILRQGTLLNVSRFNPLFVASERRCVQVIGRLLTGGAYVDCVNNEGKTPLYAATARCHTDVVTLLLDNGADVNAGGSLALRVATFYGHLEIVEVLLKRGADPDGVFTASDYEHETALWNASAGGRPAIVSLLLKHGADVNADCKRGSPLAIARERGYQLVVDLLVQHGAAPDRSHVND